MIYTLNNQELRPGVPFTDGHDIQRPGNWLELATEEEIRAAGIEIHPDPPFYDHRFYYSHDKPKEHGMLVSHWTTDTKAAANRLLSATDWYVVRAAEGGESVPDEIKAKRTHIRQQCQAKETAIAATSTIEELAGYVTSPSYTTWEK